MADDRAVAFCEGDLLVVDDDNHPTHHRSLWPQEWRAFADAQAKAKVKIAAPPDSALESVATAKECKLDAGAATTTAVVITMPSVTTGSDRSDGPLPVQQGMDDATPAVCQMDRRAGSSCPSSFQPSRAGPSGAASCLQAREGRAGRGGEQWHTLATTRMLLRPPQPSPQLPAPTTQGRWRTHLPCQLHLARLGSTVAAGAAPRSGRAAGAKTAGF